MKISIVVGLQYGDEGKGAMTSFLSTENDLVVRFNGGHQAGHTVEKNGYRHVFSTFCSGTLNGTHSYISEYCTMYPIAFYHEQAALIAAGYTPTIFVHPLTMITTPFDVDFNKETEKSNNHGSVGVGFGATIARNTQTPFKLFAIDLTYKEILIHKLRQIASYYNSPLAEEKIEHFLKYVEKLIFKVCTLAEIKNKYRNIIFEGAQGIMLDMDFGFFPNVTRSNTTSKNAMAIIKNERLPQPDIYYCMRSYLTRHGNGFMPNETKLNFDDKTNTTHKFQGRFRQGCHSLQQLKYAIKCDSIFSGNNSKHLSIICLDQTDNLILIDNMKLPIEMFVSSLNTKFKTIRINNKPLQKINLEGI